MLLLRRQGWDFKSLGIIFAVDFSSIYHWCKVMEVKPEGELHLRIYQLVKLPEAPKELPNKVPEQYLDYVKDSMKRNSRNPKVQELFDNL